MPPDKTVTAALAIRHCVQCPHHVIVADPGSDDSFDAQDVSLACAKTKPTGAEYQWRYPLSRPVSRCERGAEAFAKDKIPRWCPIKEKKS